MNITVKIAKVQEGKDTYFLGTSDDISGFLVEGNSFDEVVEISPDVAKALIEEKAKREKRHQEIEQRIKNINFAYSVKYV